jgi:putative transposase
VSSTNSELISSARSISDLKAHLVLVPKYRQKLFNKAMLVRLEQIVRNLLEKWQCKCIEFNGEKDHIHLLFQYTPQVQLSKLVNNLKTVSSRYLKKEFQERFEKYYWKDALWSGSYYISSCGGVTIETLRKYVSEQNRPKN